MSTETTTSLDIREGQIWQDCDLRFPDRRVRIVGVAKDKIGYRSLAANRLAYSSRARFVTAFRRVLSEVECEANARLIAAAPDYHEAAVAMLARHDAHARDCNFTNCGCDECRAFRPIVEKAEGHR